jgi:L-ascorbate metabolism protein UlaG (beta-lactamase superfamily)
MNIIWHGQSFFEINTKDTKNEELKIAIDPFDKSIGLKLPKVEAQILLITHNHLDHSNKKAINGSPFLIETPGEYETKGVYIKGVQGFHDDSQGKEKGKVVFYIIEVENIRICHLSDIGQKELTSEQIEQIGNIDILMIPVGGVYTLDAKQAANIISQIEPKIVIPMHYQVPNLNLKLDSLDQFLKEIGSPNAEPQKKFKIKVSDIPKETMQTVVFEIC